MAQPWWSIGWSLQVSRFKTSWVGFDSLRRLLLADISMEWPPPWGLKLLTEGEYTAAILGGPKWSCEKYCYCPVVASTDVTRLMYLQSEPCAGIRTYPPKNRRQALISKSEIRKTYSSDYLMHPLSRLEPTIQSVATAAGKQATGSAKSGPTFWPAPSRASDKARLCLGLKSS